MNRKLPYYMAYPMPLVYDDEKVERRDFEYMKSLYPDTAKRVLPYVEEECNRLEYHCSVMYDEYPDKLQLRLMGERIYNNVCKEETMFGSQHEEVLSQGRSLGQGQGRGDWLCDLIEVMLFQELYKRRCDNRRHRRKFY